MIVLNGLTDKLQLLLGEAVVATQLTAYVAFNSSNASAVTPAYQATTTSGLTTDITTVPSTSTYRSVSYISVFNPDTISHNCTIILNVSATQYILVKALVPQLGCLMYNEKKGFYVVNAGGNELYDNLTLENNSYPMLGMTMVVLSNDVANASATPNTFTSCGNLLFNTTLNVLYYFKAVIYYDAAATTTGSVWSIEADGIAAGTSYTSYYGQAGGTETRNAQVSAFNSPATSNTGSSRTAGNFAVIEGFHKSDLSGILFVKFASEIASSAITAKQGSYLIYRAMT